MAEQALNFFDDTQVPWLDQVDAEFVNSIPYLFAKRNNVLALFQDKGQNHILCSVPPSFGVVTELRRKLASDHTKQR